MDFFYSSIQIPWQTSAKSSILVPNCPEPLARFKPHSPIDSWGTQGNLPFAIDCLGDLGSPQFFCFCFYESQTYQGSLIRCEVPFSSNISEAQNI